MRASSAPVICPEEPLGMGMPLPSLSGFEVVFEVRISPAYLRYVFEGLFRKYRPPEVGMQNNPCCIDERQKAV